jgi:hypothetical protein
MRIPIATQPQTVAVGRGATSAQSRHATADLILTVYSSRWPHPHSRAFATGTAGAPLEGLLFAPLPARSRKDKMLMGKLLGAPRNSR